MNWATYCKIFVGNMVVAGIIHILWHGYVT